MSDDRIVWARHPIDDHWHAIKQLHDTGSTETYCRGRWASNETCALDIHPPFELRCKFCDDEAYRVRLAAVQP